MTLPFDDDLSLGLLFHLNSEPWLNGDAYADPHAHVRWRSFASAEGGAAARLFLPAPTSSPLRTLIERRVSCRSFSNAPIAFDEVGALLDAAYGATSTVLREAGEGSTALARPVPSAGALYPLELFAICDRVAGVAPGVYHYQPRDHAIERTGAEGAIADLIPDLMHQPYVESAAALIVLTAMLRQTMRRYGPRGYRYVLFEAGHAAQNLCLRAAELELGSLCLGGFTDHRLNRRLGLRGDHVALYVVAVGKRQARQ